MPGYGDVLQKDKVRLRVRPRRRGHLLSVGIGCLSIAVFAAISETAMASVVVSNSFNRAIGCAYDSLGPGDSFQGTAVPSPPAPMQVDCNTDSQID